MIASEKPPGAMMRKSVILFLALSCLIVVQPLPGLAQVVPQAHASVHMSMNTPMVPVRHHDRYQSNNIIAPAHHYGEHQHNGMTLHHTHHYSWQHLGDVQPDKQQAQINLNLSSSNANMAVGHLLNGKTITIDVGGQQLSVTNHTPLTAGEYMAVFQVVHGGQQTILLNSVGETIGGTVVISSHLSNELSSLVVPQGVTVIDLTSSGNLNLTGGIVDSGSLYVASFNPSLNSIAVNTNNISVLTHGTFSNIVSAGILPFLGKADANLNFNLNSANGINNAGTIVSGGNLNLNPGTSIVNAGLIQSTHGNINILPASATSNTLNAGSTGGTWQATSGNINIGYAAGANTANQSLNVNLVGGNYLSQQLNLNLGCGALVASVQNVTGVVNASAGEARLLSSAANLQIGNWNIGGDPTIANDNTITLTGNIITDGAPVTIVSGQNVVSFNPVNINTSSAITSGGNINIIAGATFTPDPYTSGNVNILGASATGGSINLSLGSGGINTQAIAGNNSGGNVILAAFAGAAAGSGTINLPSSSTIYTGGSGNGSPGHVFMIAGANTGSASVPGISIGTINTVSSNESGGPGASGLAGGHIVLANEQPNASISNPWTIDPSNGTTLVGGPLGGAAADAPISVTGIATGGGQIIVFSGLGITVGNNSTIGTNVISTVPAAGSTFPGGMVSLIANAYGSTSLSISTDIIVNGNIVTSGPSGANSGSPQSGAVVAMTTGSVTIGNITTSNTANNTSAKGGSVYIVAGSPYSTGIITLGNIDTHSQYANAGSVELISMGTAGGGAGNINVGAISTYSTNSNGAPITISSPGTIVASGAIDAHGGNGIGGSLFVGSGAQFGTAINVANGSTINTSGTVTSGGVYLLAGNAGDTITHGTITVVPIEVISAYNPAITSIIGNAGTIQIILGTNSGTSTLSQYVPGGYGQINDQVGTPGGVQITPTITNGDPNVSIPIVSLNSALTLLGAPGSSSSINSNISTGVQAGISLLSPNGIFIGSSNATFFSFPNLRTYIGLVASNGGTVDLDNRNSGVLQQMSVGLAASASGPLSVINSAALNISNTVSASSSVTLGSGLLLSGLILSGSVTSASAITLISVGTNSVTVAQNGPGTIEGATLNLVNIGSFGTFNTDVTSINVETYTTSTISINNASNISLSVPQAGSFSLSSGGQINLTGAATVNSEFSLSGNADVVINKNILVNGANARIDLASGNTIVVNNGATINAAGTSTGGGLVQLAFSIPNGPLTVVNNGIIEASNPNNTSVVGFNSGSSLYIHATGTGAIIGAQVNFGNLDPTTLQMQGPFQLIASPLTGGFSYGNIYVQQGFILATAGFIRVSEPLISSNPLTLFNSNSQQQNALYEQIGTRIATDYTPWTTHPELPRVYKFPLQGNVSKNRAMNTIGEALFAATEFNATAQSQLLQQGIVFGPTTKNNFFDLVKGFILFMPTSDISVQTREGLVHIPKGAQVWVMETGADVAIYDLHDNLFTGPVKVTVNNKEFILAPGKELLLTRNSQESFAALNPGKDIAYRSVSTTEVGAGIKAYLADFSITQGIKNVDVINNLLKSNNPSQRKAARRMMKNATILADLTGEDYTN